MKAHVGITGSEQADEGAKTLHQGGRSQGPHGGGNHAATHGSEEGGTCPGGLGRRESGQVGSESSNQVYPLPHGQGQSERLASKEKCRRWGEGYEDKDHIVFECKEMWRLEDLDDKRWIVLVEKKGGKENEIEEWDPVVECFSEIHDPFESLQECSIRHSGRQRVPCKVLQATRSTKWRELRTCQQPTFSRMAAS